ncbi:MAG: helix-turn-helix transcriptional regulator [Chlorobi bacterium]|nr:helix-turn-helix transcriptional regulator [Chlorobiota bacterium]
MTKLELFDPELQQVSAIFKAMAHPARLAILDYIAETGVCISGDISSGLPLGRTTVNQHLKELKEMGLIKGHISGKFVNYCLNPDVIRKYRQMIVKRLDKFSIVKNQEC